jgi:hypothetical protein
MLIHGFTFGSGIIEVIVDKEKQSFFIYQNTLRASSVYFDRALNRKWIESNKGKVVLDQDDPTIFGIYYHWLHRK